MPASDSEDFESADEGHSQEENKERKKRLSSSNYSDKSLEKATTPQKLDSAKLKVKPTKGWDDFDIDVDHDEKSESSKKIGKGKAVEGQISESKDKEESNKDTGWDDFDDWGETDEVTKPSIPKVEQIKETAQKEHNLQDVTERLAQSSSKSWGWGWGVDSLLSTASAGITTLTSQVSQGISTVLESGIGAPDPEELARLSIKKEDKLKENQLNEEHGVAEKGVSVQEQNSGEAFQFGSLFSGVTKFVESTGSKVISGGLDTLETIGKKTMEVLQDGDPGLAKKRAMLGLDSSDKPVLSQVLREAKSRADEEDKIKEAKREAKEVHYENLFDDFEGLVHLEALEMLSRQVSMRIEERLRVNDADKRQDIKETLQQVAELCEMPEEDDDGENNDSSNSELSKPEAFHERLQAATQDLGLKLTFQPLVKQYEEVTSWLSDTVDVTERAVFARGVSGLAQCTALSVEVYHKAAEMLLVKTRRSTADESDAMTQLTVALTKHISELATLFTEKLNSITSENKEQVNTYITNIFLEAGNSSTYIQNAFQLTLPILQIGAV